LKHFNQKTIGDFCNSRDNNLNLLRFLAAFAVVWSHAALVVGGEDAVRPLIVETGFALGHLAVNVFFIISGFLIAQSLDRSKDLFEYFSARFLRLMPGLFAAVLVTVFVIGPLVTTETISSYFAQLTTWIYVPLTGSLLIDNGTLPGVFSQAPLAYELNASIWTLRWEALAYVGLALLGALGLMSTRLRFGAVFGLFVVLYLLVTAYTDLRENIAPIDHLMRFGLCFLLGTAAFVFRNKIPVSLFLVVPACLLPALVSDSFLYQITLVVGLGFATFWLAYVPNGVVRQFNKIGDFSYGIYIYGFPIKQVLITFLPDLDAATLMLLASPIILAVAAASYYLIERPALKQRRSLAAWTRRVLRREAKSPEAVPAE